MRVIKRYSNRKLYDTLESRYITLEKIGELVRGGTDVKVVDNQSGEDISKQTLAQVILTMEKKDKNFMPISFMKDLLQRGSESMIGYIRKSVSASRETVTQLHEELERFIGRLISKGVMSEEEGARLLKGVLEKAERSRSLLEQKIDHRLRATLEKLDIPSAEEVSALRGKIDELIAKIDTLVNRMD
ncbi:phasin family protein [bacterium]|nr:phasin family protein [candidate division CSSED10-310 bacterium]